MLMVGLSHTFSQKGAGVCIIITMQFVWLFLDAVYCNTWMCVLPIDVSKV